MNSAFIVTNYNKQAYLGGCLYTLLNQEVSEGNNKPKVFIYDDGSTDYSDYIITKMKELYPDDIIYRRNTKNLGISKGFNILSEMVLNYNNHCKPKDKIDFVMIMGSDDISTQFRTELTIKEFTENSDIDCIYGSFEILNCLYQPMQTKIVESYDKIKDSMKTLKGQSIPHGFLAIKTKCLDVKYNEELKVGVDHEYILGLMDKGYNFKRIEPIIDSNYNPPLLMNPLGYYIITPSSVSITHSNEIYKQDEEYFNKRSK